jgi:hypothetical protein
MLPKAWRYQWCHQKQYIKQDREYNGQEQKDKGTNDNLQYAV